MNLGTPISLSPEQRAELQRRVHSQTLDVRAVRRARIVLLAAEGKGNREIARELGIGRIQVARWRDRFAEGGLVCDNYSTHKHPNVQAWLAEHPRFHMHFTPTSASWLNMVERFFRDLNVERLERGVFRSVPELIAAIEEYLAVHNRNPKPFIWTAKAQDILQKVIRANRRLGSRKNEALH